MTSAKQALQKRNQTQLTPADNMRRLLLQMSDQIAMALPKNISSERFQRVALTAFSGNKKLQQADPVSFLAAMMQSAQLGLEPNTPLGEAYLIPYKGQIQFQIGYKGLINLAFRSGQYESIYAHTVREEDEFDIDYGLEQKLVHKPKMNGNRGNAIGYYAVYKLTNGGYGFAFMTKDEVEQHAKRFSQAYGAGYSSPWKTDFDEMAKKTVLKKVLKYAPKSIEVEQAVNIDEQVTKEKESVMEAVENNVIDTIWQVDAPEEPEQALEEKSDHDAVDGFFYEGFQPRKSPFEGEEKES